MQLPAAFPMYLDLRTVLEQLAGSQRPAAVLRSIAREIYQQLPPVARELFSEDIIAARIRELQIKNATAPGPHFPFESDAPRAVVRPAHVVRPATSLASMRKAKLDSAEAVMMIDGTDIMNLTIGQLRTAGKRRAHEIRVIEQILREHHWQADTATVSQCYNGNRERVAEIVRENKG